MRALTLPVLGAVVGTFLAWIAIPAIGTIVDLAIPAQRWFEVRGIEVRDTPYGHSPQLFINRVIRRNFTAYWTVTLRRETTEGYSLFCARHGRNDYRAGEALAKGQDLNWWMDIPANPRCPAIPPGRYMVTIAWILEIPGLEPKTVRVESNVFEVTQ